MITIIWCSADWFVPFTTVVCNHSSLRTILILPLLSFINFILFLPLLLSSFTVTTSTAVSIHFPAIVRPIQSTFLSSVNCYQKYSDFLCSVQNLLVNQSVSPFCLLQHFTSLCLISISMLLQKLILPLVKGFHIHDSSSLLKASISLFFCQCLNVI